MTKELKKLLEKIEELGWSIENEGENQYRLAKHSPAGQDFSISVEGESPEDLIDDIHNAYENYDVSQETYLWLDNTGHGTNGVPYEMRDVLEDMEACKQMISDLHYALNK